MAASVPLRRVLCYHCGKVILVPTNARTASCSLCYKGVILDDLAVRETHSYVGKLVTCGKVTIGEKARTITKTVEAGHAVEIAGFLDAKVSCGGTVHIGPNARVKGDCEARTLVIEEGALIDGGFFRIGPDAKVQSQPPLPAPPAAPAAA